MPVAEDDELIKILVVGPGKGGKSFISNLLGGVSEVGRTLGPCIPGKYNPTVGVRILEAERNVDGGRGMESVQVQLWDCSSDNSREDLWPAMQKDAGGALLIYDPDNKEQEAEANVWFEYMIERNVHAPVLVRAALAHTLVIRHRAEPTRSNSRSYASEPTGKIRDSRITKISTDSSTEVRDLEEAFDALLRRVLRAQRRREEGGGDDDEEEGRRGGGGGGEKK